MTRTLEKGDLVERIADELGVTGAFVDTYLRDMD